MQLSPFSAPFWAYKKVHKVRIKASLVPWVGHLNGKSESDLQFGHMCELPMAGQQARQWEWRGGECIGVAAGSNECWPDLSVLGAKKWCRLWRNHIDHTEK